MSLLAGDEFESEIRWSWDAQSGAKFLSQRPKTDLMWGLARTMASPRVGRGTVEGRPVVGVPEVAVENEFLKQFAPTVDFQDPAIGDSHQSVAVGKALRVTVDWAVRVAGSENGPPNLCREGPRTPRAP